MNVQRFLNALVFLYLFGSLVITVVRSIRATPAKAKTLGELIWFDMERDPGDAVPYDTQDAVLRQDMEWLAVWTERAEDDEQAAAHHNKQHDRA